MRPIAKRPVRRQPATAQRDRRFPRQIPLHSIRIDQRNRPFHPKRPIRPHRNLDCSIRHRENSLSYKGWLQHSKPHAGRLPLPAIALPNSDSNLNSKSQRSPPKRSTVRTIDTSRYTAHPQFPWLDASIPSPIPYSFSFRYSVVFPIPSSLAAISLSPFNC